MIRFCEENIGHILWSNPIVEWHGLGWHIKSFATSDISVHGYEVDISDDRLSLMFALKFL